MRITPANNNDVEPMVEILKDIEKRLGKKPKYMGMDAGCHNAPVYHQLAEGRYTAGSKLPEVYTQEGSISENTVSPMVQSKMFICIARARADMVHGPTGKGIGNTGAEPKKCKECPQAGEMLLRQIQQKAGGRAMYGRMYWSRRTRLRRQTKANVSMPVARKPLNEFSQKLKSCIVCAMPACLELATCTSSPSLAPRYRT